MQNTIHRQILKSLLVALRPLIRALLRAGIGHREFAEISKSAFVDIASKDYGLRGRPTNISRIAVMTGLTRKEVRRLRDKSESGDDAVVNRPTPMAAILHRWFTEPDFLTAEGKPREIEYEDGEKSFSDLVKRYGGDIPAGAMRTELKRINAIVETEQGKLRAIKRNVSGLDVHERLITGLGKVLYPATLALEHNTADGGGDTWVMRTAATKHVRDADAARLRRISSDRLGEFVESVDDLFAAYETLYEGDPENNSERAIGVGVFYFEENSAEVEFFK